MCCNNHKKRKDSLECSLDRVLFAADLEFLKILVLRLLQHASATLNMPESQNMVKTTVLFIWDQVLKVYEPPYIAYLATSGSKRETTK